MGAVNGWFLKVVDLVQDLDCTGPYRDEKSATWEIVLPDFHTYPSITWHKPDGTTEGRILAHVSVEEFPDGEIKLTVGTWPDGAHLGGDLGEPDLPTHLHEDFVNELPDLPDVLAAVKTAL